MEKESVLVCDEKGFFLRMFKKEFNNEFNFTQKSFVNYSEEESFDRFIFVVYDKLELIEFLKLEKKGSNVLVCLFNEILYGNLSFLEEINNLIMLDGYKTKKIIVQELRLHFRNIASLKVKSFESKFSYPYISQTQFDDFFKTVFLFI
jgi:hypothetical protein